jgi:tetratricopeptide (TPR) repeat protein
VLHQFAGRATHLAPEYRDDFFTFVTECLVRAVELRLRNLPAAKLAEAVDQNEGDGFILVRAFNEGLQKYEQAEPAMTFYYPELITGIDVAQEAKRLEKVQFATGEAGAEVPVHRAQASELDTWLREGEVRIASQDGAGAASWFEKVLARYPGQPRALYGLAVARVLQKQGEEAKALFLQLVAASGQKPEENAPDPLILAWSHVHLGRIYDIEGNRDLAVSEYRAALNVEGAPAAARVAARRGLEKGFEPARPPREPGHQRP